MSDQNVTAQSQGLAVTGFVLALIGLVICPPLGLIGLIVSAIALAKASGAPDRHGGKGLAIAGVVIGVVSILWMFLLLPAIMLPALGQARQTAQQLKSSSQLRAISQGLVLYSQNYNDHLPPAEADWVALLISEGYALPELFVSPGAEDTSVISYFYVPADTNTWVSTQVLVYEMPGLFADGVNIAYHDNHAAFETTDDAERLISSLKLPDGTPWAPHLNPRTAP